MPSKPSIPQGWRLARLGDVAEVVGGSTPSRVEPSFWGGAIPWLVPSELTGLEGRYLKGCKESITGKGMKSAGLKLVPAGSVLLTSRATVGVTAINSMPLVTNQGFQNLVVNDRSDALWLYYCVSKQRTELQKRASGSTFKEVSRDSVRNLPILLPPLPEQRAIAAVLDSIDNAIEGADAVIAATERLRDSLLHQLLTRGVPGWHTEWKEAPGLGTIPAGWEVVRLGEVAEVNPRRPSLNVVANTPVTFLPMSAIAEKCSGIVSREMRPYRDVAKGYTYFEEEDILFSKITPCLQNGKHTLATGLKGGFGFGTTEFHVVRATPRLAAKYLFRISTQAHIIDHCTRSFTGTAGQQRVQPETLKALPIPLAPLPEQRAIAAMLDGVDASRERAREEWDGLQLLKESTADALLTGRVRVGKRKP